MNYRAITETTRIFFYFFWRDWYLYKKQWKRLLINFGLISPVLLSLVNGYIIPYSNLSTQSASVKTSIFVGAILWTMFPMAFTFLMDFFLDLEQDRFINYQITILSPRLVLLQKALFTSVVLFIHLSLFFPIAWFLLGDNFYHVHWNIIAMSVILYLGGLFCSIFNLFFMSQVEGIRQVVNFWLRFNMPMIKLGGLLFPWYVMMRFSKAFGFATLFNPMMYITEGLRSTIIGGTEFIPFWLCALALTVFCVLFMLLAWRYFKKKLDHI